MYIHVHACIWESKWELNLEHSWLHAQPSNSPQMFCFSLVDVSIKYDNYCNKQILNAYNFYNSFLGIVFVRMVSEYHSFLPFSNLILLLCWFQMDVWSYGLVVLELAIGNRPDRSQLSQQIQQITYPKLKELVTACTEIKPDKRPSMQKVVTVLKEKFI